LSCFRLAGLAVDEEQDSWHSHQAPEKVELFARMMSHEDLEIQRRFQKLTT
jgi:hypothetical protein